MARNTPVVACTRNAVSVAAPSVCIQLTSRGTLRKRKYLTPPTMPVRSSIQSSGSRIACSSCRLRADLGISAPSRDAASFLGAMSGRGTWMALREGAPLAPRHRNRIEPALPAVHVDARRGRREAADLGAGAGALDVTDR